MHEWILGIGRAVLEFFRNINTEALLQALEITLLGWGGIFVVMAVIILIVWLLNKIKS